MHKKFDHQSIEKKWQNVWSETGIYTIGERDTSREKEYVLVELPYPSGNLHIGHWYAFSVLDIYVRYKRMLGKQVLFPIGFDAFGLPAENAAIKRGLDPKAWTESNIAYMKNQLDSMGNAFSWDKTATTTDPEYYAWTQWMFTEFFRNHIAYRGTGTVNWCPGCNTVIANEQVLTDGTCERSGDVVEHKQMPQWMLRITAYADRLLCDLESLPWPEHIKEAQRRWIGKSAGAYIPFTLSNGDTLNVFTTRPDTLYGVTFLALAPEHELFKKDVDHIVNKDELHAYIKESERADEKTRTSTTRPKSGVRIDGITARHPYTGSDIPLFCADYVLGQYGTGAVMGVPAHDQRDFEFAHVCHLPAPQVIAPIFNEMQGIEREREGVYALIRNEEGEYLLQFCSRRNHYWLPGGGIESGEGEEEALIRELIEETGYTKFYNLSKLCTVFYDFVDRHFKPARNKTIIYTCTVQGSPTQDIAYTDYEKDEGIELIWCSPKTCMEEIFSRGDRERSELIAYAIRMHQQPHAYADTGILIDSGEFSGKHTHTIFSLIVTKAQGTEAATYRLRDWSIGRQRYWGVPIPIVYDPEGVAHPVPKEYLPWLLPTDVDHTPTGIAPLAKSAELKARVTRIFGEGWTPEYETMDTFVDSSWYFLRYLDASNKNLFTSIQKQKEWMPVDLYFGGAEHTTMHLLYSRFWHKALFDLGYATTPEPYTMRINRGLILGPDGNKMSKSKGNVIDPDEVVARVGADSVKMYLAFMGPYGEGGNFPWDLGGIAGVRRFLERVYGLRQHIVETQPESEKLFHKTLHKVTADIEHYKFNTAISACMIFINHVEKYGLTHAVYTQFLVMLAPFAPHLTEELWWEDGHTSSIHAASYPTADPQFLIEENVVISVQINGKMRGTYTVHRDISEHELVQKIMQDPHLHSWTQGTHTRTIFIPGKICNLIIDSP